jgi:hypothetical protein
MALLFATPQEINSYIIETSWKIDSNLEPWCVHSWQRENSEEKEGKDYKEGYSTFSPAELSNEMLDDFKVILRVSSGTQEKS